MVGVAVPVGMTVGIGVAVAGGVVGDSVDVGSAVGLVGTELDAAVAVRLLDGSVGRGITVGVAAAVGATIGVNGAVVGVVVNGGRVGDTFARVVLEPFDDVAGRAVTTTMASVCAVDAGRVGGGVLGPVVAVAVPVGLGLAFALSVRRDIVRVGSAEVGSAEPLAWLSWLTVHTVPAVNRTAPVVTSPILTAPIPARSPPVVLAPAAGSAPSTAACAWGGGISSGTSPYRRDVARNSRAANWQLGQTATWASTRSCSDGVSSRSIEAERRARTHSQVGSCPEASCSPS